MFDGQYTLEMVLEKWNVSKCKQSFAQVGQSFFKEPRSALLVIILDSCHGGHWVNRARELKLADVVIQSASRAGEQTFVAGVGVFQSQKVPCLCSGASR